MMTTTTWTMATTIALTRQGSNEGRPEILRSVDYDPVIYLPTEDDDKT